LLAVQEMTSKFGGLLKQAAKTCLPDWSRHYNGLAAVLLLDQYSRQVTDQKQYRKRNAETTTPMWAHHMLAAYAVKLVHAPSITCVVP